MLSATKIQTELADSKITPSDTTSFEKRYYQQGMYYLQHVTQMDFVRDIVKSGFLLPRTKQFKAHHENLGGVNNVSYLSPYNLKPANSPIFETRETARRCEFFVTERVSEYDAVLIFSAKLLAENTNFYANKGWNNYGKYTANSLSSDAILKNPGLIDSDDEICFTKSIDLSKYLIEIWVAPGKKAALLKTLRPENVATWAPKVKEMENHPEITVVNASASVPQRMKDSSSMAHTTGVRLFRHAYSADDPTSKDYVRSCSRGCF